ncbi:MAG: dihydroorotase [Desulfitobacteriaceae bacterium]|nr:dihydroorotase [Desulfitobacteriaceae bacterium]
MKLLIKGGRVIDPAQGIDEITDVLVENGIIVQVGADISSEGAEVFQASGKLVCPGFIDMHVHLREPGLEAKETIATGTRAAAAGGFASVACMPNTLPVADNRAVINFIRNQAQAEGVVNVWPIGAITKGSQGKELAEIGDMFYSGAKAISDDGHPVMNGEVMRCAMDYAKMFDLPIISHCEDLNLAAGGNMNEGLTSVVLGLQGIPAAAEEVMVARDIILARLTGCKLHICHVSTAGSVELVRQAKKEGLPVTAEVTPHHLTLTEKAVEGYDPSTKVNPPLRSLEDVAALKKGLQDGTIDCIVTDHAPHTVEEKAVEYGHAPCGIVGLETAVPLVWQALVIEGVLTPAQLVEKFTVKPAGILGLDRGTLIPGKPADITILDETAEETVDVNSFYSKGKNSPYHGWKLKCLPVATIVGGKVVMTDGKLTKSMEERI